MASLATLISRGIASPYALRTSLGSGGDIAPFDPANYEERDAPVSLSVLERELIPDIIRARARREEGRIDETHPNYRAWPYPHIKGPADSAHDRRLIDAVLSGRASPEMIDELVGIQGRKGVSMPLTHGRYRDAGVKRGKLEPAVIRHYPDGTSNIGPLEMVPSPTYDPRSGTGEMIYASQSAPGRRADMRPRQERLDNADWILANQPGAREHGDAMYRSRGFVRAVDEASEDGERGVRDARLHEIQQQFSDSNAWPVGAVAIGGADPDSILRGRKVPKGSLGALSARIAGLAPPTGYVAPPEAEPDFMPRGDGKKFGEIQARRVAALKKAAAGGEILARMQAGENVSPAERRQAYRFLAARERQAAAQAKQDNTLAAAVSAFRENRTPQLFRQAVAAGDMQSARALLAARQQELAQEDARGDADLRGRALDMQGRSLDDRYELMRMQEDRLREQGQGELSLGRERLGLGRDELDVRRQLAENEQRGLLSRMLIEGNQAAARDATRFGYEQRLQQDRSAADRALAELRLREAEAVRRENRFNAIAPHLLAAKSYELEEVMPRLTAVLDGDVSSLAASIKSGGASQPKPIESRIRPELLERWDVLSGGDAERIPLREFILKVPRDQRKSQAFKDYIDHRYTGEDVGRSLNMGPLDYSIFDVGRNRDNIRRLREARADLFPEAEAEAAKYVRSR